MKMMQSSILCLLVLFSTQSFAFSAQPNTRCSDDALQAFVVPGAKGYLVNLVFVRDKELSDVSITYRIKRFAPFSDDPPYVGPWVTKNMQSSSQWYYTSNRIDVLSYEVLEYRFAYNLSGSHCTSKMYTFSGPNK
jgi:hypothetical protein